RQMSGVPAMRQEGTFEAPGTIHLAPRT
ncbi:hypothetical protein LCGC14_1549180, partial [marine sediment metagenome]